MTCIIGVAQGGNVWMGADSCCNFAGIDIKLCPAKIWRSGESLVGVAGSGRVSDIIRYVHPVQIGDKDPKAYFAKTYAPLINKAVSDEFDDKEDNSFCVLVGHKGQLFILGSDMGIVDPRDSFTAIGMADIAIGSLSATINLPTEKRILFALQASTEYSLHVQPPFYVINTLDYEMKELK